MRHFSKVSNFYVNFLKLIHMFPNNYMQLMKP